MNKQEFAQLADAMRTYYPAANMLPNAQSMALWYEKLKDIDYKVVCKALDNWVSCNKWAPTIADLRSGAVDQLTGTPERWEAAWRTVKDAIRHFGAYQEKEAMASFDDVTRECVRCLGFIELCQSPLDTIDKVDRANFRMIYEAELDSRKRHAQTPEGFKMLVSKRQEQIEG